MKDGDKDFFAELLLIIGGYIIAETIIRTFLDLSKDVLPWWILPLLGVGIFSTAISIRNNDKISLSGWIGYAFITLEVIAIVLVRNSMISQTRFMFTTLVLSIIASLSFLFDKARRNRLRQ